MENTFKSKALKQAFNLLRYTFVVVPIVAGADKYRGRLVNSDSNYIIIKS